MSFGTVQALVKALAKAALKPLDVQQTRDIETTVAGIRADKLKEKTAAEAAKKGVPCGLTAFAVICQHAFDLILS